MLKDFKFSPPAFLVIATTIGFFMLIGFLYWRPVQGDSKDILEVMLGSVGASWTMIVGYYFGSSSGSSKKTELMSQTAATAATATATTN